MKNILLTGGTGLVGQRITQMLLDKGYEVGNFSRSKGQDASVKRFVWNPAKGELDDEAIRWAHAIIHLAGANVGAKRWDEAYKREIMESRTKSTKLIVDKLNQLEHQVKTLVSTSAIGIYRDTGATMTAEDGAHDSDFMAEVCKAWEAVTEGSPVRTVRLRVGVVLSPKEGALEKIAQPIRLFAGAPLGSGQQYTPWIHLDDIARMFIHILEHEELEGVFNGVAPHPVTNAELTKQIAKVLGKPLFLPSVPDFMVKVIAGGMATSVLKSFRLSSQKIQDTGFHFQYPALRPALEDLL